MRKYLVILALSSLGSNSAASEAFVSSDGSVNIEKEVDAEKVTAQSQINESQPKKKVTLLDLDWGTNYDPKDQFCGPYDCYAILGLDYDKDRYTLTNDDVKKAYRSISRKYHPDKIQAKDYSHLSKSDQKRIKKMFPYVAKANEVLTDEDRKMSFDYYFKASDAQYDSAFNKGILGFNTAPKSDVVAVLFALVVLMTGGVWVVRRNQYDYIKRHVVMACKEDWSPIQGGGDESIRSRKVVMAAISKLMEALNANGATSGTPSKPSKKANKKGKSAQSPTASGSADVPELEDAALFAELSKVFAKFNPSHPKLSAKEYSRELERYCVDKFSGIVVEHLYDDFGGGYRKPRAPDDLLPYMVFMALFVNLPKRMTFGARWFYRRHNGMDFDSSEIEYLTKSTLGVRWDILSEAERAEAMELKVWEEGQLEKFEFNCDVRLYGEKKAKKIREFKLRGDGYDEPNAEW